MNGNIVLCVGVCAFVGGLCLLFKEMLTSPRSENYPTHAWHTRLTGTVWGTVLVYRGVVVITSWAHGTPRLDDDSAVLGSVTMVAFLLSKLVETLEAKAPARAWKWMHLMQARMRCRRWAWLRPMLGLPPLIIRPDPESTRAAAELVALAGDQIVAPGAVPPEWVPPEAQEPGRLH